MMCYIFDDEFLRLMVNGRKNVKGQLLGAGDPTFLKREKFGFFQTKVPRSILFLTRFGFSRVLDPVFRASYVLSRSRSCIYL